MNRLLRSGAFLGAAFLLSCFATVNAFADTAASTTKAAPAAETTKPAAATEHMATKPAAATEHMATKPAMAKHHHKGMSLAMRKDVQTALNSHGANLKVDGMLGKQSREAIKKFQSENGLKATGWLNKATLEKLGVK